MTRRTAPHISLRSVAAPFVIVAAAMVVTASPSAAAGPRIVVTDVDFSFPAAYFTGVCGIAVEFFNIGTIESKLFTDASGEVVREIDTTRGDKVGWTAPTTGQTIVFPNAAKLTTIYPDGATVGNPARTVGSGVTLKVAGLPADAGRAVFSGHVVAIDADGVPIVAFDEFVSFTGHENNPDEVDAAICAALTA